MRGQTPAEGPAALGIDVGLSGTRAAIVGRTGRTLGTGSCPRRPSTGGEGGGRLPELWRGEIAEAARRARAAVPAVEVAAVAVGAVGPCTLLVDAQLEAVAGPLLFSDPVETGGQLRAASGAALPRDHVMPSLAAFAARHPESVAAASFALDATGYLVGWLTGVPVMDEITAADYLGCEPVVPVPEPLPPGAVAGTLLPAVAEVIGLPPGVPVAVGTYDSYVDLMAMGLDRIGDAGLLLGSTMVAIARAPAGAEGAADAAGLRALHWPGGALIVGGWTSSAGDTLEWSRRTLALSDEEVVAAGQLPPGAGGLLSLPYLAGERTPLWDDRACGAVVGLRGTTSRLELHRAALDGVVLSTRQVVRMISACVPPRRWRVGGGGTRNAAWLQATADALGTELEVLDAGGGIGAAVLALAAIGVELEHLPTAVVLPDDTTAARYDRLADLYESLYPRLKETMHDLTQFRQPQP